MTLARGTVLGSHARRGRRRPSAIRHLPYRVFRFVSLSLVVVVFIGPIVWMILASFKTAVDIYNPANTFVFTPTLANYGTVFGTANFLPFIWNSLVIGVGSTGLSLVLGLPAAYAISRFSMDRSARAMLAARIIPGISLLVPWYFVFYQLRLVGSYWALIISHMFLSVPLIIWLLVSFFDSLPRDLEEAAECDGATPIGAFWRIALPLSAPGVATAAILALVFSWNNFMFSMVLSSPQTQTLPVALLGFQGYASIDWGGLMAASVVITMPIMILALFAHKYVVSGLTTGASIG